MAIGPVRTQYTALQGARVLASVSVPRNPRILRLLTLQSVISDYVNNNPADFANAYWDFAAVRVYE